MEERTAFCYSERDEGLAHSGSEKEREPTDNPAYELCSAFGLRAKQQNRTVCSVDMQVHCTHAWPVDASISDPYMFKN